MADRDHHAAKRELLTTLTCAALAAAIGWVVLPALTQAKVIEHTDTPVSPNAQPAISIEDAGIREGSYGVKNLMFRVRLSAPLREYLTLGVRTLDSTATAADQDYEPLALQLTFAPGSTAESLAVAVRGDARIERTECFRVRLTVPTGIAVADSEAVGMLVNDDLPTLSIDDALTAEGDIGLRALAFTVRLSEPALDSVVVAITSADSTATLADADYVVVNRSLVFPPGSTTQAVDVKVIGDLRLERDEQLKLRLTRPIGAVLADSEAVGTLMNEDLATLTVVDTAVAEGNSLPQALTFRVRLSPAPFAPVTFHYQTADGTALSGEADYQAVSGDTLFQAGQDQILVTVPVQGDALLEGNDRLTLQISQLQGAVSARPFGIGTICNDERASFTRLNMNVTQYFPGTLPPAFGDCDGDGRPDLPLYLNNGSTFVEMPGVRALLGDGNYHGAAWCDYDRDGDMDFVIMPYNSTASSYNRIHLFENRPSGFVDVAPAVGMDVMGFGETPVWGDFNADGWPDLFLPFYSHVAPFRSYFYLNLGGGQFREFADSAGIALQGLPIEWRPEGVAVMDWNGDGALDLYCANHLFINDGDAHFTDVRAATGLPALFDEGSQFVDYDDDGDPDLYVRTSFGPTLWRNDEGKYVDVTSSLGIGPVGWEWGDRWADLDSDGDLDLLYFPPSAIARLLLNQGNGAFRVDSSFTGTFSGSSLSSFADIDGDGDLDIAVGADGRMIARNLTDQLPRGHNPWLKVRVEDDAGRLAQYGATVRLRSLDDPKHPVQTRVVDGGSGYLGQDEYTLTFGGLGSGAYDLEVSFPSKPGVPRVVGPAQNAALASIRPGDTGPGLIIVRPSGTVIVQSPAGGSAPVPPASPGTRAARSQATSDPATERWTASPNPTQGPMRFALSIPGAKPVTLTIHDLHGRQVRVLTASGRTAGRADVAWDLRDDAGRPVAAGIYFVRRSSGESPHGIQRVVVLP